MVWIPLGLGAGLLQLLSPAPTPHLLLLAELSVIGAALSLLFALAHHKASLALGAGLSMVLALDLLMTQPETADFASRFVAPMLIPMGLLFLGSAFWAVQHYQVTTPQGSSEGRVSLFSLPNRRFSSPVMNLLRKELRLQRAALWPILAALISWLPASALDWLLVQQASVLLVLVLPPALAGCSAMAEERRWGTLPMQLSQPTSRRAQWACKWGVGIALSTLAAAVAYTLNGPEWTVWMEITEFSSWWKMSLLAYALAMVASRVSTEPVVAFAHAVALGVAFSAADLLMRSAASLTHSFLPIEGMVWLPITVFVATAALWIPSGQSWRLPWSKSALYLIVAAMLSLPASIQWQSLHSMQKKLDVEVTRLSKRVDSLPSSDTARAYAKARNLVEGDSSRVSDLLPHREDRLMLSHLERQPAEARRADRWLSSHGNSWVGLGRGEARRGDRRALKTNRKLTRRRNPPVRLAPFLGNGGSRAGRRLGIALRPRHRRSRGLSFPLNAGRTVCGLGIGARGLPGRQMFETVPNRFFHRQIRLGRR